MRAIADLALAVLPVLSFLAALLVLDSYKLVRARRVMGLLLAGGGCAGISLLAGGALLDATGLGLRLFTLSVAPLLEELLKGTVVAWAIVRRRVGFPVDAAIVGFAVGAGFSAVENLRFLLVLGDPNPLLWVVRGFGTALMHGSVTAVMAIVSQDLVERMGGVRVAALLPGWLAASALHALFNSFLLAPGPSAALLVAVLPFLAAGLYHLSELRTREWLGTGFDTDAELYGQLRSGRFSGSRVGRYLATLTARFEPETVVDMLCLLRLRLELSIRGKGILLMRQAGLEPARDPEVAARFAELAFLEDSVGPTGLLALRPVLSMSDRDLWQYHMLGSEEGVGRRRWWRGPAAAARTVTAPAGGATREEPP